jgi:hypothetical protein
MTDSDRIDKLCAALTEALLGMDALNEPTAQDHYANARRFIERASRPTPADAEGDCVSRADAAELVAKLYRGYGISSNAAQGMVASLPSVTRGDDGGCGPGERWEYERAARAASKEIAERGRERDAAEARATSAEARVADLLSREAAWKANAEAAEAAVKKAEGERDEALGRERGWSTHGPKR